MLDRPFFLRFSFPIITKNFRRMVIFFGLHVLLVILVIDATCSFARDTGGNRSVTGKVWSTQLIENSREYDGKMVIYEGEVIDPILFVGKKAWLAINDDHYSNRHRRIYEQLKGGNSGIPVLVDREYAERIKFAGSYNAAGDRLSITGIFHESNPQYGGELMIEALSVEWVRRGFRINRHDFGHLPLVFTALLLLTIILFGLWLRERKRAEKASI